MRKIILLLMMLAALLPIASSCSDDDNGGWGPGHSPATPFSFMFSGTVMNDSVLGDYIINNIDSVCVTRQGDTISGYIYIPLDGKFFDDKSNLSLPEPGSYVSGYFGRFSKEKLISYNGKIYSLLEIRIASLEDYETDFKHPRCGVKDSSPLIVSRSFRSENVYPKKIKIAIHVLRNSDGSGGGNLETLKAQTLKFLGEYFEGTQLSFEIVKADYKNYFTSATRSAFSFDDERTQTPIYALDSSHDMIHIYYRGRDSEGFKNENVAGISQSTPGFGIIINGNYADILNPVGHELGHCFGLYHTFKGTSNDVRKRYGITSSEGEDGVSELVDGTNSDIAGDGITDTPADPNLAWGQSGYEGGDRYKDANGEPYRPDRYNIMSYSWDASRFSQEQIKMMHYTIRTYMPQIMVSVGVSGPEHFSTTATFTPESIDGLSYRWKITAYAPSPADDSDPIKNTFTYPSSQLSLTANGSQLFELELQERDSGTNLGITRITAGPPSPICGSLFWKTSKNGTWEGSSTNKSWGSSLSVYNNTTIYLEYQDLTGAKLTDLNYKTVTSAHRVLTGSIISVTAADCAQGFLKFRISDSCGESSNFFTIPVTVVGGYYAVTFGDNDTVSFSGKTGATPSGRLCASPKVPNIVTVEVYNASGKSIYQAKGLNGSNYTITTSGWNSGEYIAVISDGNDFTQSIPFVI